MGRIGLVIAAVTATGAGGCSQPALRPSFTEGTPSERTLAATRAAATDDRATIPQLIDMLDSQDPAQRMVAADSLERITGQTLGYFFADPEPRRSAAVDRWRAWYVSGAASGTVAGP